MKVTRCDVEIPPRTNSELPKDHNNSVKIVSKSDDIQNKASVLKRTKYSDNVVRNVEDYVVQINDTERTNIQVSVTDVDLNPGEVTDACDPGEVTDACNPGEVTDACGPLPSGYWSDNKSEFSDAIDDVNNYDDDTEGLCFGGEDIEIVLSSDAESSNFDNSNSNDPLEVNSIEKNITSEKASGSENKACRHPSRTQTSDSKCISKDKDIPSPTPNSNVTDSSSKRKFLTKGNSICSAKQNERKSNKKPCDFKSDSANDQFIVVNKEISTESMTDLKNASATSKMPSNASKSKKRPSKLSNCHANHDETIKNQQNLTTLNNTKSRSYWRGKNTIFVEPELLADIGCEVSVFELR